MPARLAALCLAALAITVLRAPAAQAFEYSSVWQTPDPFPGKAPGAGASKGGSQMLYGAPPKGTAHETYFDGSDPEGEHPVAYWEYSADKGGWVKIESALGPGLTYDVGDRYYAGPLNLFNLFSWNLDVEDDVQKLVWEGLARNLWGFGGGGWEDAAPDQDTDVLDHEAADAAQTGSSSGGSGGGTGGGSGYVCVTYDINNVCTAFGFFP